MQGELIKAERDGNALNITAKIFDSDSVLDKVAGLAGNEISITISKPREKRSINANDYFWLIVGKIADKMRTSKDEIYLKMLQRYGQHIVVTVKTGYDISKAGFKYYEKLRDGLINGKEFTAWRIFIGSSQYSKEEMSILIDGAISEAKELGISTELDDFVDFLV